MARCAPYFVESYAFQDMILLLNHSDSFVRCMTLLLYLNKHVLWLAYLKRMNANDIGSNAFLQRQIVLVPS